MIAEKGMDAGLDFLEMPDIASNAPASEIPDDPAFEFIEAPTLNDVQGYRGEMLESG